ncbi:MAG TPA: hypothetical protein PKC36_15485, partial [Dietzia sp.]|nr:hypothetical protein [Dietzia sp.]
MTEARFVTVLGGGPADRSEATAGILLGSGGTALVLTGDTTAVDPRLDIKADTKVDSLSVSVTVKGSAAQPEIAFMSTPALP